MNRIQENKVNLIETIRNAWNQLYAWTMVAITNIVCDFGNTANTIERILIATQNIAGIFEKYYGHENAVILRNLLTNRLYILINLINALYYNNTQNIARGRTELTQNADETALFLETLNYYWDRAEWQKIFANYSLILQDRINCTFMTKDEARIEIFEQTSETTRYLADYMSSGIINQFNIK